jgi:hypothetical protein
MQVHFYDGHNQWSQTNTSWNASINWSRWHCKTTKLRTVKNCNGGKRYIWKSHVPGTLLCLMHWTARCSYILKPSICMEMHSRKLLHQSNHCYSYGIRQPIQNMVDQSPGQWSDSRRLHPSRQTCTTRTPQSSLTMGETHGVNSRHPWIHRHPWIQVNHPREMHLPENSFWRESYIPRTSWQLCSCMPWHGDL